MIKNLLTLLFFTILSLSLHGQDLPTPILPELTADVNDEEIEIDVKVVNFTDMVSMQFTIAWDSTKLEFIEVTNYNLEFKPKTTPRIPGDYIFWILA